MKNRSFGVMTLTGVMTLALLSGCAGAVNRIAARVNKGRRARPISVDHGKVFSKGGKRLLWGGKKASSHFDISRTSIETTQLHYGVGREAFDALITPRYNSVKRADEWLASRDRVLALKIGDEVRVYPISLLKHHEVINDVVGGRPIFAAYCVLADLGAVYDRRIGDRTHTFALSGYTYFEPEVWEGKDGFVLWDRETESLWWPQSGQAVSGGMAGTPMKVLEKELWSQTTWGKIKKLHPEAKVLSRRQTFTAPSGWKRFKGNRTAKTGRVKVPATAIAPRWGENPDI